MTRAPTTRVAPPRHRDFLPRTLGERARGACWSIVRFTVFRWSPPPLHVWRRALLRLFGARVHRTAHVAPSARIDFPWNLRVEEGVTIAGGAIVNCMGEIAIGAGARIDRHAHLCAGTHDYRSPEMPIVRCPITIGAGAWIRTDAFVGPGVTVGEGAQLSARSSAFRDLPAGQLCEGEPARGRGARER